VGPRPRDAVEGGRPAQPEQRPGVTRAKVTVRRLRHLHPGAAAGRYPDDRAEQVAVAPGRVGDPDAEPVAPGGHISVQPGTVAYADDQEVRAAVAAPPTPPHPPPHP